MFLSNFKILQVLKIYEIKELVSANIHVNNLQSQKGPLNVASFALNV